jgi:hypothetical protein
MGFAASMPVLRRRGKIRPLYGVEANTSNDNGEWH